MRSIDVLTPYSCGIFFQCKLIAGVQSLTRGFMCCLNFSGMMSSTLSLMFSFHLKSLYPALHFLRFPVIRLFYSARFITFFLAQRDRFFRLG